MKIRASSKEGFAALTATLRVHLTCYANQLRSACSTKITGSGSKFTGNEVAVGAIVV